MTIAVFNPSITSSNLGDQIIIDAVEKEISSIFPFEQIISIPTQEKISTISIGHANRAMQRIVGGTNLLSSHMLRYKQWQINLLQTILLRDITLMGVGWWQYQENPDYYTRKVLTRVLSEKKIHSVRDEYTKDKLVSIGVKNVINTGCPTMWQLTPEHCSAIPSVKSDKVIFTLTDYHKSHQSDVALVELLKHQYDQVYFWPQGAGDLSYLHTIGSDGVKIISPSLNAYNSVLKNNDSIDFIGTRLHGGVRALQLKHRALILAVDNRAIEISRNTNLSVIDRHAGEDIKKWIMKPERIRIEMNFLAIDQWKDQFRELNG